MFKLLKNFISQVFSDSNRRLPYISKGQLECAQILKDIYPKYTFKTVRPGFLKNPKTNRNLELDLYCEELKLAIEYNGAQHYHFTPHYHRSENDFKDQQRRDRLKKKLCLKNGVKLIVVPFSCSNVREFIVKEIQKSGSGSADNWCVIV